MKVPFSTFSLFPKFWIPFLSTKTFSPSPVLMSRSEKYFLFPEKGAKIFPSIKNLVVLSFNNIIVEFSGKLRSKQRSVSDTPWMKKWGSLFQKFSKLFQYDFCEIEWKFLSNSGPIRRGKLLPIKNRLFYAFSILVEKPFFTQFRNTSVILHSEPLQTGAFRGRTTSF